MGFDLTSNVVAPLVSPLPAPSKVNWSLPIGYLKGRRQITTVDPTMTYVDGSGATADVGSAAFEAEFTTAAPGLLHGLYLVSTGNWRVDISDMYNASTTDTKAYTDASSYTYSNDYFSFGKIFEPQMATSGIYIVNFAKPVPFKVGLRVSWDSGSGWLYALWSTD